MRGNVRLFGWIEILNDFERQFRIIVAIRIRVESAGLVQESADATHPIAS